MVAKSSSRVRREYFSRHVVTAAWLLTTLLVFVSLVELRVVGPPVRVMSITVVPVHKVAVVFVGQHRPLA